MHDHTNGMPRSHAASWRAALASLALSRLALLAPVSPANALDQTWPGAKWPYSDGGANWLADHLTTLYARDLQPLLQERILKVIGVPTKAWKWRENKYREKTLGGLKPPNIATYPNAPQQDDFLVWNNADGVIPDLPRDALWAWGSTSR